MAASLKRYPERSLQAKRPKLALQWDYEKNYPLTPADVFASSAQKHWWKCGFGHRWEAAPNTRGKDECQYCTGFRKYLGKTDWCTQQPLLYAEWDHEANSGVVPQRARLTKKYWWKCLAKGHSFDALLSNRLRGSGCRYCAGFGAFPGETDLPTLNPRLASEFDEEKNQPLRVEQLTLFSSKWVWWRCNLGHSFRDSVSHRTSGRRCCYCSNKRILSGFNDLEARYPLLAKEWDQEKNGGLLPSEVFPGTVKKYWWICPLGHSYHLSPNKRTSRGHGCPECDESQSSKIERAIFDELEAHLEGATSGTRLPSPMLRSKTTAVDILGTYNGNQVVVEYDSDYWHASKLEVDKLKTEGLLDQGYIVVRIRVGSLPLIDIFHLRLIQISVSRSVNHKVLAALVLSALKQHSQKPINVA